MAYLTIALAKGRPLRGSLALFERVGFDIADISEDSRKLIFTLPVPALLQSNSRRVTGLEAVRFLMAKPSDVPVYVEYGAADLGIVGRDVLYEADADVYEPLSLDLWRTRMVVAGLPKMAEKDWRLAAGLRVATKFPHITRRHFLQKGISVEVIPLNGSIELAPLLGLADLIVDLTESGTTLRENGLVVLEEVMDATACLIVNRASHKLQFAAIGRLIDALSLAEGSLKSKV